MKSTFKKVLKWTAIVVVVAIFGSLALLKYVGAWRVVFPSHQHETVAPAIPPEITSGGILVFSKTNAFRHKEAIPAGVEFFESLAGEHGWPLFHTENGAVFNTDDLARFSVVVFHNASGDILSRDQQKVFETWLQQGGGWLGIHAAGDSSHAAWPWYMNNLIGVTFTAHPMDPQFQVAQIANESPEHPVMAKLPKNWAHEEEWYSWDESPRAKGFSILASIDENTYSPIQRFMGQEKDLHMGDHPIIWSRCVQRGRAIYSALGHQAKAYTNKEHQQLLENAVIWAMDTGACSQ